METKHYMVKWWTIFSPLPYEKYFNTLSEAIEYKDNLKDLSQFEIWNKLKSINS